MDPARPTDLAPLPGRPPALDPATAAFVRASRSEATLRAYAADWRGFVAWCEGRGRGSLPADPATVADYLAAHAQALRPSTLSRKIAAISVRHKGAGLPTPCGAEVVLSAMAGIRRTVGVVQTKKAPVRVAHLRGAFLDFPSDLRGKRDKALILLGYAGAFRRSELVALDLADVGFRPEGAAVAVRRSKTDQEGRGHAKAIPFGRDGRTCPVAALRAWIEAAGIEGGPLFRRVDRWGNAGKGRLSAQTVALVVKGRARLLGLDPDALGAHSLRSGLVTDAYAAGAAETDIMRQTGHRSRTVLEGYYREANLFRGNVADRVGL